MGAVAFGDGCRSSVTCGCIIILLVRSVTVASAIEEGHNWCVRYHSP